MLKLLVLVLFFVNALLARGEVSNDTKLILKVIEANQKATEARFDSMEKRFEQIDKRFDQVDKRFEQVDRRFEQVDKRFEQQDKKIDEHFSLMKMLFGGVFAALGALYYYLLKERQGIKKELKLELSEEIDDIANKLEMKKADNETLRKLFKVIESLVKKDEEARKIFEQQNLRVL